MKRILVTSALPYANGPIHIGQLAGVYLPADIYVRYQRLKKRDVIHICGTDEHGVLIALKAFQEKTTPSEIVNKYYENIKKSFLDFGIEFTNFSRTTKEIHKKNVQDFFLTLHQKGYITPKETKQLYCSNCKRFLPERFVEGICPYCGYDSARGDQCEKCGRWLEPTMLKNPKCQLCGSKPRKRKTKQWFLRLDLLQPELEKWINTKENWRNNVISFTKRWLKEGLEPRPITRDIEWGVPVPLPEAESASGGKVIYVWFEALLGYISSTMEWNKELWKDYWMSKDTELIHFLAKDNIVFHAIVWPCMLIAHGDFILPTQIPANEFLNLEGKKISTSRNWAIWLPEYLKSFEPDPLRYALGMNLPEKGDVDFSWTDFIRRNNDELTDILGNFVHRTLSFITKYLHGRIPYPLAYEAQDTEMFKKIEATRDNVGNSIEKFEFKSALKDIMALAKEGNRYFDYNKPWEQNDRTPCVIYVCTTLIANLGTLLNPFLPFTAGRINQMLGLNPFKWDDIGKIKAHGGGEIKNLEILFKKLEKERIEVERKKLGRKSPRPGGTPAVQRGGKMEYVSFDEFKKLDLRIAEIKEASKVSGADKLLNLKVIIGDEERQIVAGIAKNYSPDELIGKKIVVLTNLEPRTLKGERSEGMLLAASEGDNVVLLVPDKDISSGAGVS